MLIRLAVFFAAASLAVAGGLYGRGGISWPLAKLKPAEAKAGEELCGDYFFVARNRLRVKLDIRFRRHPVTTTWYDKEWDRIERRTDVRGTPKFQFFDKKYVLHLSKPQLQQLQTCVVK